MPDGVPNYLTTNADGSVTANFSGGVVMPLQPGAPVPDPGASIAWEDGPGGTKLAYLAATKSAVSGQVTTNIISTDAVSRTAQLRTVATPSTDESSIRLSAQDSGGLAGEYYLLDSNDQSDFLRLGGGRGKRFVRAIDINVGLVGAGAAFGPIFTAWGATAFGLVIGAIVHDFGGATRITTSYADAVGGFNLFGFNNAAGAATFRVTVTTLTDAP